MKKQYLRCVKTMLLAVVACMALMAPPDALADPLTVTTLQDGVPGSLREAILASPVGGGGTIDFSILGTIKLTNELVIDRHLSIIGPGKGLTVSGNNSNRVFNIAAGATVSISGLSIANGRVRGQPGMPGFGGGIYNVGTLTVSNCTIWYNAADYGGGIQNSGVLTINNSTFCGNFSAASSGGIRNEGRLTVNNSTFTGNTAGGGGGAIIHLDGTLTVNSSTLSGNKFYVEGGGITRVSGPVTILNTIIAGNTATSLDAGTGFGPDVAGIFTSQGHNLIGKTNDSRGWVASDLSQSGSIAIPQIALLGPFGPNGGPTFTMVPRPGSVAIDRGSNSVLLAPYDFKTDQRGFPRRYGSFVDIGAVEFDPRYFDPKAAAMDLSLRAPICTTCPLTFSFTTSFDPGISSGNIAFVGRTEGGQQSLLLQPLSGPPTVVANTSTAIPGGTGNFVSLLSGPSISGQNVAFSATGASGQQGVYAKLNGTLTRIADLNTPIPGGTGNFTSFTPPNPITPPSPNISGQNVAFIGSGSGGQQGLYLKTPPNPVEPLADLNTEIPRGTGNFTGFQASSLVGEAAVFIGDGAGGQSGVYVKLPDNPVWNVADTQTLIPGSSNLFVSFNSASYDGSMVAFSAGQWISAGGGPIFEGGVYKTAPGGPPFTVADDHTAIPGGTGFFTHFGQVAIDSGAVAFLGWRADGPGEAAGIYTDLAGCSRRSSPRAIVSRARR